jgi:hypothetical protein
MRDHTDPFKLSADLHESLKNTIAKTASQLKQLDQAKPWDDMVAAIFAPLIAARAGPQRLA